MARRDPWLFVGLLAFFGLIFLALFGERIAPHEAIYFAPEHGDDPRPSSSRELDGNAHKLTTAHGDLIPALDLYAEKASARHETTRTTASASAVSEFAPLLEFKTVVVSGTRGSGDLRPDAAALVGYLAGRLALGAEELPR